MEQYTPKERAEIVQLYIQNNFSIVKTKRAFRSKNKIKSAPGDNTIRRLYAKFVNSGNVSNASHASRQRTRRSDENIEAVRASVEEEPTTSSRRRSQELGNARTTLRRIIRVDCTSRNTQNFIKMESFVAKLPKIELHAHLNGCLTTETLMQLGKLEHGENIDEFKKLCENFKNFEDMTMEDCFEKFKFAHKLTQTKKGLQMATFCVIRDFAKDNVIYLELRTTPKATAFMSKEEYLETVIETILECQISYPEICVKLLPSFDRSQPLQMATETYAIVCKMLRKYSNIIKGVDFSGNPNVGHFSDFKTILEDCRSKGLKLAVHCGEVDNYNEVKEMISFGMDRCGHAVFVNAQNLELLIDKNIPVECCLTSNILCGTVKTYEEHHFRNIMERNHPVLLCTDDFGVFDTTLSKEILIAIKTFNLKSHDIYSICKDSITYSFANDQEKQNMFKYLEKYFELVK